MNEQIKKLIGSMNIISIKILAGTKRWVYSISKEFVCFVLILV